MGTKILALGYNKAAGQPAEVWVALDLLGYECTTARRPMITGECSSLEELNEEIDAVIAELEILRGEARKLLAEDSN